MDAAKWSQGFQDHIGLVKPMEEMVSNTCTGTRPMLERKTRPPEQLNCPRCNSTNTKFCYYNNYSLTQPRYFCKTCRRYWTEGGSLRNVPVGGGSRKNKRSSFSSSSSSSSSSAQAKVPDLNPKSSHKGQDLNLAFPVAMQDHQSHHGLSQFIQMPKMENNNNNNIDQQQQNQNYASNSCNNNTPLSALELLRTGMASRGLNSFINPAPSSVPESAALYSTGFSMQDYKPATLSFSIDGMGNRGIHGVHQENNGGRLFFPFGEMKPISSSNEVDHHQNNKGSQQGNSAGYWNNNGVLGGGSW